MRKNTRTEKRNEVNLSPIPISPQDMETALTCHTLHFGTAVWISKHLVDSVHQIISNSQRAQMLSACPSRIATQKLQTASIILPKQEFCKYSHTDNPLLLKTQATLNLHN